jgi:tRNA(fMet)-specific endonuclease VapC
LVLDTDVLTIIQRGAGGAYEALNRRILASGEPVAVTIISIEEQMRGWLAFVARAKTREQQVLAYARLHTLVEVSGRRRILDFDAPASIAYEGLTRARLRVGTMDLKIAAITLANDATLLSRNLTDFRKVPGLRVGDWTV